MGEVPRHKLGLLLARSLLRFCSLFVAGGFRPTGLPPASGWGERLRRRSCYCMLSCENLNQQGFRFTKVAYLRVVRCYTRHI